MMRDEEGTRTAFETWRVESIERCTPESSKRCNCGRYTNATTASMWTAYQASAEHSAGVVKELMGALEFAEPGKVHRCPDNSLKEVIISTDALQKCGKALTAATAYLK